MNGTTKKGLILAAAGFPAGILAGLIALYAAYPEAFTGGYTAGRMIRFLLLNGLYGAVATGTAAVYDIERWSVTRATVTHFLIALGGFYALGFAQGWLRFSTAGFWIPTACWMAMYFVIWRVAWLFYKRKTEEMNRELAEWKSVEKTNETKEKR